MLVTLLSSIFLKLSLFDVSFEEGLLDSLGLGLWFGLGLCFPFCLWFPLLFLWWFHWLVLGCSPPQLSSPFLLLVILQVLIVSIILPQLRDDF